MSTQPEISVGAKVHFEKDVGGTKLEHDAVFSASADPEQLKWALRSPMKEGLIEWKGAANHVRDNLEQHVSIRQVPLKDIVFELQTLTGVPKGVPPRFVWLSCELNQSGALSRFPYHSDGNRRVQIGRRGR